MQVCIGTGRELLVAKIFFLTQIPLSYRIYYLLSVEALFAYLFCCWSKLYSLFFCVLHHFPRLYFFSIVYFWGWFTEPWLWVAICIVQTGLSKSTFMFSCKFLLFKRDVSLPLSFLTMPSVSIVSGYT